MKKGRASAIVLIGGQPYRLWVVRNISKSEREPLVYLLTNILARRDAPDLYRLRWKIEYLFKHLKTNGYNLEHLGMKDPGRIRLLVSLVIVAYIIAVATAVRKRKRKPVRPKKYRDRYADPVSVFKQGQSLVKQAFVSLNQLLMILIDLINYKSGINSFVQ